MLRQYKMSNSTNAELSNCITGDLFFIFLTKRQLPKIINIIAVDGAMGMYAGETDAKVTSPIIQPSILRPAIKSISNKSDSLCMMI